MPGRIFKKNINLGGRGIPKILVINNPKYSICKPSGVKWSCGIFKENIKLGGRGIPTMLVIDNPKYSICEPTGVKWPGGIFREHQTGWKRHSNNVSNQQPQI